MNAQHTPFREALMTAYVQGWYAGRNGILNDDGKHAVSAEIAAKHPQADTAPALAEALKDLLFCHEKQISDPNGGWDLPWGTARAALKAAGYEEIDQ